MLTAAKTFNSYWFTLADTPREKLESLMPTGSDDFLQCSAVHLRVQSLTLNCVWPVRHRVGELDSPREKRKKLWASADWFVGILKFFAQRKTSEFLVFIWDEKLFQFRLNDLQRFGRFGKFWGGFLSKLEWSGGLISSRKCTNLWHQDLEDSPAF